MWRYVTDALGELGPHVVAADLPTMNSADATLADDVSHVRGIAQDGCGVLCGHSYGGAVIAEAGATMEIVPGAVEVEGWWSPSGRCRSGIVGSHLTYS
jgi:pimeloyl-ACP methyl ester carboxylesterase